MEEERARRPAIMWVSKPLTRPHRRARPSSSHPRGHSAAGRARRAGARPVPQSAQGRRPDRRPPPRPPRPPRRWHALGTVLAVAACAVLSGATSLAAIAEWAADAPGPVLATLGVRRHAPPGAWQPPAEATMRRVLARVPQNLLADLDADPLLAPGAPPRRPYGSCLPGNRGHLTSTTCLWSA